VQHLLDSDSGQHAMPVRDSRRLLAGESFVRIGLEAEARVQVLAHDHVLDLRSLRQQVPQVLAVHDDDRWLGRSHEMYLFRAAPP